MPRFQLPRKLGQRSGPAVPGSRTGRCDKRARCRGAALPRCGIGSCSIASTRSWRYHHGLSAFGLSLIHLVYPVYLERGCWARSNTPCHRQAQLCSLRATRRRARESGKHSRGGKTNGGRARRLARAHPASEHRYHDYHPTHLRQRSPIDPSLRAKRSLRFRPHHPQFRALSSHLPPKPSYTRRQTPGTGHGIRPIRPVHHHPAR
jgi:hypothetical protein